MSYLGYARPTENGGRDIRIAPRFETGDQRYAHLNEALCVGCGALDRLVPATTCTKCSDSVAGEAVSSRYSNGRSIASLVILCWV